MSDQARPNTFPWPPLVYFAAAAIAVLLDAFYPLPWITRPMSDILFAAGLLIALAALGIAWSAVSTMRKAKTAIAAHRGAEHLVTAGAFSFTRNPIYFSATLLILAVGLIAGNVWFLLLAVVAAFTTQKLAIEREEKHLEARFGKKYRDYAKRVRRWI